MVKRIDSGLYTVNAAVRSCVTSKGMLETLVVGCHLFASERQRRIDGARAPGGEVRGHDYGRDEEDGDRH
jgi:hypothetical protein